ncbi:Lipoprotein releasing system transmembrane protein LolC [hydrothermal vent metagenome]|uniref:Lipoprotein releasing system transmembrane protein LolC n=1 Tax=hydrothermal vent metagenome TaxID=652676 RepID=A0A1W1EHR5_9ZZZZ
MSNPKFINSIIKHYLKYDRDNPFISISAILAFLGITAGVMVLMLAMGIMNGTQEEFMKRLTSMNYPLTVESFNENAINDNLIISLEKEFPNMKFSPYYTTQVITKYDGIVQGNMLYGVDFDREKEINEIVAKAIGESKSKFKIIIGKTLSLDMNIYKDDKLTLYFSQQQAIGFGTMPLQKRFKVDGIFDSGLQSYDKAISYTTLEAFEKLLKRAHGLYDGLHIYSPTPMQDIDKVAKLLPQDTTIQGWWQQNGNFFSAMEMEKKALFLVLLLIILVASLNIISSLLMIIMSRRSEIALMMTLGASSKEIKSIFFRLGAIIGFAGMITGTIFGAFGIWLLKNFDIITLPADVYGTSRLPIDLIMSDFIFIIIGTTIIVLLSSIYPAIKASKTDPLKVLRNE